MDLKQTAIAGFLAGAAAIVFGSEAGVLPYSRGDAADGAALERARADVAAATERSGTLETELGEANGRIAELEAELDTLQSEVERLTAELEDRDRALEAAATEAAGNVDEIARLNVMVAERDAAFERLTEVVAARDGRIADLARELESNGISVPEDLAAEDPTAVAGDGAASDVPAAVAEDPGALTAPDTADIAAPDPDKILAGDDEARLAGLMPPTDAPMTQMELFEQALAAAKPVPAPPPAAENAALSIPAQTPEPVSLPGQPLVQVHFETGSAKLTPGGRIRALAAAAVLVARDPATIRLTGHTDTTGSVERNLELSRARAQTVADLLVEAGLPRDRITLDPMGQEASVLPIPTGDGVSEPLNRCVGIFATL